jgi:hypothetical protein
MRNTGFSLPSCKLMAEGLLISIIKSIRPACNQGDRGRFELLPVKKTVKNHKIFATSNITLLLVVFMVLVCPEKPALRQRPLLRPL